MTTPPYVINEPILNLIADIQESLGFLKSQTLTPPSVLLRKQNKIRTIQSSLAIEGNSLSLEQVSAILEGKRVLGSKKEILEVHAKNKKFAKDVDLGTLAKKTIGYSGADLENILNI